MLDSGIHLFAAEATWRLSRSRATNADHKMRQPSDPLTPALSPRERVDAMPPRLAGVSDWSWIAARANGRTAKLTAAECDPLSAWERDKVRGSARTVGLLDSNQCLAFFHSGANGGLYLGDFAAARGEDEGVHLHGFQSQEVVTFLDLLSGRDDHGRDSSGERTGNIASLCGTTRSGGRSRRGWRCGDGGRGCSWWWCGRSCWLRSGQRPNSDGRSRGIIRQLDGDVVSVAINCNS
jgi:hypothetical protein